MPTQINTTADTVLEPAKTADGWHLDTVSIVFNSTTIDGLGKYPEIHALFVPWYDDNGTKVAIPEKKQKVSVTNPVRVGEIYDMYVNGNAQLGPVLEELVWKEAQSALSIPQAQIDALGTNAQASQF